MPDTCRVVFSMQTNAMLVDDEWVEALSSTQTRVGVSIDGPREVHDRYRLDHHGRGTYDRTVAGLRLLQQGARDGAGLWGPGVICVIDPATDAGLIFDHLTSELNVRILHYVLPDGSHVSVSRPSAAQVSRYLCDLWEAWCRDGGTVQLRMLDYVLGMLSHGQESRILAHTEQASYAAITVASNGELGPDDKWRSAFPLIFSTGSCVQNSTLRAFLSHPDVASSLASSTRLADECTSCCWKNLCQSGNFLSSLHRFAGKSLFNRRSVYCESIQALMIAAVDTLVRRGLPFPVVEAALSDESTAS